MRACALRLALPWLLWVGVLAAGGEAAQPSLTGAAASEPGDTPPAGTPIQLPDSTGMPDSVAAAPASSGPPPCDIFIASLKMKDGLVHPGTAVNFTRRPGYENQPTFSPDGDLLLYSAIDSTGQADIHGLYLPTGLDRHLTQTPESEYSPTFMPDSSGFSAVRVMTDGTQRLWLFDFEGKPLRQLVEGKADIGYHAWAGRDTLALFVLGEPPSLAVTTSGSSNLMEIAPDVGRSLQRVPGTTHVSYATRTPAGTYMLAILDAGTLKSQPVADSLPQSMDHAWVGNGIILMAMDRTIFQWTLGTPGWGQIVTFPDLPGAITRIAISPKGNRMALVVNETE